MVTKPTLSELVEARRLQIANHRCIITPEMEAKNLIKTEWLRQMTIKGSSSYFFIELSQKKFTAAFSAYHHNLIHPVIHVSDPDNLTKVNKRVHPDTLQFNIETDVMFYDLMMEQSFEQRKNFVGMSTRCILNEKGTYDVWFIRTYVDECDVVGIPCSLIVKAERMDIFSTKDFHPYRQFYLANETHPDEITLLESNNQINLTDKELKVFQLGAKGLTIEEAASKLGIDETTIKSHRAQAMLKLNAPNFRLACIMAKKLKIV